MCVKNIARDQKHLSMRETADYKNTNYDVISNTAYSRVVALVVKIDLQVKTAKRSHRSIERVLARLKSFWAKIKRRLILIKYLIGA